MYRKNNINLIHILLVSPILIYVGLMGALKRKVPLYAFYLLLLLGVSVLVSHSISMYKNYRKEQEIQSIIKKAVENVVKKTVDKITKN